VKAPSAEALGVIADWPSDEWITEAQLAETLPEVHRVRVRAGAVFTMGERKLDSVLSEARRAGLLIRDRRGTVPRFKRTPTGAAAADRAMGLASPTS
jgi:hypothetical protein